MACSHRISTALVLIAVISSVSVADDRVGVVDYVRQIRPILTRNCFTCHGPDEAAREAGLRLDQRQATMVELDSGDVGIVPGHPDQSELYRRIVSHDESLQMPPSETGRKLTDGEVKLIRRWIEEGAPYAVHWAFEPLTLPDVPQPGNLNGVENEIDAFVRYRLENENLKPNPPADRFTLIRRLSLDLIGLPPTQEEVLSYVNDDQPNAYRRLVDRLLDSPHFGERWGRHWLDVARYADSDGYLGDDLRPHAYRYRDWVIDAVNQDLPFDEFTIQQVAGDLLENATTDQRIATGFHRNVMKNTEAGFDKEADRVIRTVDRVSTVGTAWMGLTVGCAECHSHKYDPISHREFYALYAFFNNLEDFDLNADTSAVINTISEDDSAELQMLAEVLLSNDPGTEVRSLLDVLKKPATARTDSDREKLQAWLQDLNPDLRGVAQQYELMANRMVAMTGVQAPTVTERKNPRQTHIHQRGDFRRPGEPVAPGTPAFLPPLSIRGERADRLDLARWLVDETNPLAARTPANHIWMHLFGRGLVDTPGNLGISGSAPTHPALLDWLACQFIEQGWSRKKLIRLIVSSATYQQSSRLREDLKDRDPDNVLLARQSRFRLEAEVVRDLALSASGLLSRTIGGPSILPPLNSRLTEVSRNKKWKVSEGSDKYRRGMYILFRRATPYPMLTMFDAPDATTSCTSRERSNSPLQALTLLNDPVFVECARKLGGQLAAEGSVSAEEWITQAFWKCLSRPPQPAEMRRMIAFYTEQKEFLKDVPLEQIRELNGEPVTEVSALEQAARIVVARGLMNLDEFISRP